MIIVKVLIPGYAFMPSEVLLQTKAHDIEFYQDVTPEIASLMHGRNKVFFHAIMTNDGRIKLQDEAPWQEW